MAWNEPGDNKDKDPWSGGNGNQGPPDLDEVVKNLQKKFGGLFGGGKSGGSGGHGNVGIPGIKGILVLLVIGAVLWAASGFYIIDEGTEGVELRFGKYSDSTSAGLHWHLPYPIEKVEVVDVQQVRTREVGYRSSTRGGSAVSVPREALMLTEDENIIDVRINVQYKIKDARDYLFNVEDPDETLKQAAEASIREVVGKNKMDFVLREGRTEVVNNARSLMQTILDQYETGLIITNMNLQDAQPPEEVQASFEDAIKAREDEVRFKNEAEAYSNEVLPKARGEAARILEDANAYREQVIAQAEGESKRFEALLTEYSKAPEVTRQRLYLDSIESVLTNSSKVMMDVKGGNNLLYLPLDKLIEAGNTRLSAPSGSSPSQSPLTGVNSGQGSSRNRDNSRDRSGR